MAMGPEKGGGATLQHEIVCLDELVPVDDRYRRIDELVDWSFVRGQAEPYYAEALGRPSVDPIVLVKLMLAAAMEGIGSVRELLRVAPLRLDLRRFLGFGLGERLPAHQTVSDAQARRFLDGRLFEQLFLRSVALCSEHNLLEGTHLSIDGFHAEANAALQSLRASLEPLPEPEGPAPAPGAEPSLPSPPQLSLAEPRSGPTPKRRSSNASSRSLSDPDARLRGKPGQRPHLVHLGQVAVDPKARCVAACLGERADGFEGDGLEPLLERARFALPELRSVGADQGYAAERVWRTCEGRRIVAYIPPQRTMLPPAGERPRTEPQRQALAARERCKSERGIWAHRRRMSDAEGVISELKLRHGLGRARSRGTPLFHLQLLLGCTAINLKRLAAHLPQAAEGAAAGEAAQAGAAQAPNATLAASRDVDARTPAAAASSSLIVWTYAVCLN